ncbi:phenylalanine--tRNA ligase subunit beta [Ruminococcaceae bacterium OttesenSCG-928-L11]|nr:phenylalanine--tRNA ligase subunit beta [Ruminococcaceae bacterium OttesenSCG-928-L11]
MNLSMKWLGEFVDPGVGIKDFVAGMTMSGSKVEGYEVEGGELQNIVMGKVLSVEKHPNADTLFICKIDAGGAEPLQIVTGADNVVPGAMVPVARDNSVVHGGKKIKKGKLRGELSEGMLCSLEELGLTLGDFPYAMEDGIFLVEEDCQIGQPVQEAIGLNDTMVEFEITSNRPDCLSVIGLAREAACTWGKTITVAKPRVKGGAGDVNDLLKVRVENPQLCLRYSAAAVKNVRIGPSPRWLRERLRASGVRPINNIVDITNYVMLEYGQPMHAFDLKHVSGAQIVVRSARDGETITTLDGVERTLSPEMLVIADEAAPSAVAGVMGGEFSGIYDDTQVVIFESACFDGPSVRMTAKKLGMRTESSGRFEKGLDPENCMPALLRACELVELLGAGDVCDGVIDVRNPPAEPRRITVTPEWVNGFLGSDIPWERMVSILESLEFQVEGNVVIPPSFRGDVELKADVAEEIARIYGYNNIPSTPMRGKAEGIISPQQKFEREIAALLTAQGCYEIVTYSFISPKGYDRIGLPADSSLRKSVVISNPLGEDTSVMRTTAIPSMLDVLARNYNNRAPEAALYEIATRYVPTEDGKLPDEIKQVMIGLYGGDNDFYTLKGIVEALLAKAGVAGEYRRVEDNPTFHPGRCAMVTVGDTVLGILGEVHPQVCENYDIGAKAYLAELNLAELFAARTVELKVRDLPRFPASTRDLALVADEETPVGEMQKAIADVAGSILEKLELFDVYRGKQVGEGKKSVAYSLTLRANDRTLTDEECDRTVQKILKKLGEIGVELRG